MMEDPPPAECDGAASPRLPETVAEEDAQLEAALAERPEFEKDSAERPVQPKKTPKMTVKIKYDNFDNIPDSVDVRSVFRGMMSKSSRPDVDDDTQTGGVKRKLRVLYEFVEVCNPQAAGSSTD